jgi:outer membrane protein, multidrug efflux system
MSLANWWQSFDDPQISALVKQALLANNDVRTARAALQQSRALRDETAAGLFPSADAFASAQRAKLARIAPTNAFQAGFDASWEPDIFGGVRAGVAAADASTNAAAAALGNAQVSVAAEVVVAYMELCALDRRLAIARDNLGSQEETLQIAEWRAQAGLTTALDVEQARTSTEQTRAQIPALEASLARTRSRLAVLIGATAEAMQASLVPSAAIPTAKDDLAIAFPAQTLRQRPDIHQAEYKVIAAAAQVTQADAARYPSFNLNGTLGLSALTISGLSGSAALATVLLGSVSVPLFDGGARAAQVRAQEAALDQARIAYEAVVLAALKDVEDALVSLRTSRERLATLRRAADAAQLASLLARHRYTSGLIDFQSVLQTQVTLLLVQDSVASAQADVAIAYVQLYKALGGGWQPESAALVALGARGAIWPQSASTNGKS